MCVTQSLCVLKRVGVGEGGVMGVGGWGVALQYCQYQCSMM